MDNPFFTKWTGWVVAAWGFIVSMIPSIDKMIAFASLVVLVLQGLVLLRKLRSKRVDDDD